MDHIELQSYLDDVIAAVGRLTDSGNQMHRRGARGRRLVVFEHGPVPGERLVYRAITLRLEGQYADRSEKIFFTSVDSRDAAAAFLRQQLADMPPPIPGEIYISDSGHYGWHLRWHELEPGLLIHESGLRVWRASGVDVDDSSRAAWRDWETARGIPPHDLSPRLARLLREARNWRSPDR